MYKKINKLIKKGGYMLISIIFIFSALLFYTTSIFTEKFVVGHLKLWILYLFGSGFICDLVGTSLMFYQAEHRLSFTLHSGCGYMALFIMLAHFIWAIKAIRRVGKYQYYFTKFSIYAWIVWMAAFVSGIPKVSSTIVSWLSL